MRADEHSLHKGPPNASEECQHGQLLVNRLGANRQFHQHACTL